MGIVEHASSNRAQLGRERRGRAPHESSLPVINTRHKIS